MTNPSNETHPKSTIQELLEIESYCDEYEELLQVGQCLTPTDYLARIKPEVHDRIKPHLDRIFSAEKSSATSTAANLLPKHVESCNVHVGQTIDDRFRLEAFVGRGGTALVWKALDLESHQYVAVKIAHTLSPTIRARFEREEASSRQLAHASIPKILHSGKKDGFPYLVLDFIEGQSLAEFLKSRTLSVREAVRVTHEICQVIDYAHSRSIVHRDLKPQNVLIEPSGRLHVTDFGLARATEDEGQTLTETGEVIGTLAYMPPEQAQGKGKDADQTADVYAIGMLFYHLLVGETPFRGSAQHILHQIIHVDPPPLRAIASHIPEPIDWLVKRCLDKAPRHRFPNLKPLIVDLDNYLSDRKLQIRKPSTTTLLWKWAAKNQAVAAFVGLASVLLVSIAVFLAVTAVTLNNAYQKEVRSREAVEKANNAANAAARDARQEAKQSQRVEQILVSLFEANDLVGVATEKGMVEAAESNDLEKIFQRGIQRIRNDEALDAGPKSRLLDVLGNVSRLLGNLRVAGELFSEADKLREDSLDQSKEGSNLFYLLRGSLYRAHLLRDTGDTAAAVNAYSQIAQRALSLPDEYNWLAAEAKLFEGQLHLQQRETDEGMKSLSESLQLQHTLQSIGDLRTYAKVLVATGRGSLGDLPMPEQLTGTWIASLYDHFVVIEQSLADKNYETAIESYRSVLLLLQRHLGSDEGRWMALARGQFAGILYDGGHYAEAFDIISELLQRYQDEAPNNEYVRQAQLKLAQELLRSGEIEKAQIYLAKYRRTLGALEEGSDDFLLAQLWASFATKDPKELLTISEILVERASNKTAYQSAWFRYSHARVLEFLGQSNLATEYDSQAIEIVLSMELPDIISASWLERISVILAHNDELARAVDILNRAIAIESEKRFSDHPRVARYRASLAANLKRLGKYEMALEQLTQVNRVWRRSLPVDSKLIKQCEREIAWLKAQLGS